MRRKRLCAAISAAVMCISMLGNVPMVSMAQESAIGVEAEVEADTNVATGSDAGADTGAEAPETVDEVEAAAQEEVNGDALETDESESDEEDITLTTPQNVRVEDGFIVWDEVKYAYGYTIRTTVNGTQYEQTCYKNELEINRFFCEKQYNNGRIIDFGNYDFEVCAFDEARISTEYSTPVTVSYAPTFTMPVNVTFNESDGYIRYDAVPGAKRYYIRVFNDDEERTLRTIDYESYTSCYIGYIGSGSYWISVQAVDGNYKVSEYTEPILISYTELEREYLEAPKNLRLDESGENIVWDAVEGADYYCFFYPGNNTVFSVTDTQYENWKSITWPDISEYNFEVDARNDEGASPWSEYLTLPFQQQRDESIPVPESLWYEDGYFQHDEIDCTKRVLRILANDELLWDWRADYDGAIYIGNRIPAGDYEAELFIIDENNNYNSKKYTVTVNTPTDDTVWIPEVFYKFDTLLWDYDRLRHDNTQNFWIRIKKGNDIIRLTESWGEYFDGLTDLANGKYTVDVCVCEYGYKIGEWSESLNIFKRGDSLFDEDNEVTTEVEPSVDVPDIPEEDRITSITINPAFNMRHKDGSDVELDLTKIKIKAKAIYDEAGLERASEALGETISGNKHYNLLDLTLLYDNEDFSNGYDGLVQVIIPIPEGHRDKTISCYRLTEVNGKMTKELIPGDRTEDSYIIYLEHFSEYALVADGGEEGHKAVKTEAKAATETEAGNIEYWYCTECGKYFSDEALTEEISEESTVIPATGHKAEKTEAKAPTETEAGNIEYWHCTECGKYFSDEALTEEISEESTVIPAKGHKAVKTEAKAATETEAGNIEYWYCTECGKYFSDEALTEEISEESTVIPAKGHKAEKTEAKAPTETEAGNIEYWHCTECGKYFSDEALTEEISEESTVIPATGPSVSTEDWKYSDNKDGTITITGYMGSDTRLVVPDEIDGKKVTGIGASAFEYCWSLTSIELPEGIISIGRGAFCESGLTSIELPAGLTSIGDYAFSDCSNLTSIEIPSSVTSIGAWAFSDCSALQGAELPSGVTGIKEGAFYGCSALAGIEIPEGVKSIGAWAFYGCRKLTGIEIPEGVKSIGDSAFNGCSSLTNIELPTGVERIGNFAFNDCDSLKGIELPASLMRIEDSAFSGCSNLTNIELPSGLTHIGDSAFNGCNGLTSIKIPTGVTYIGDDAFAWCSNLKKIEIPSSVTSIGDDAFFACDNLAIYGVAGSVAESYAKENHIPLATIPGEPTTAHKAVRTEAKAPTETEAGNIAYWYCSECGKYFSDEALTMEIDASATVIPATGHRAQKTEAKAPTKTEAGNIAYWYCSGCGKYFSDAALTKEISKASTVIPATGVTPEKAPEIKGRWILDFVGWWYRHEDGSCTTNGWEAVGGKWYHFNARGYMETGWILVNGKWYYLEPSGAMATGWKLVNGVWYYLEPNGVMATGWKLVNGIWYYLEASGAMATGWKLVNGTWYYLEASGAMATGWKQVNGAWYYLKASGAMATGWLFDRGTWYYLYDSGAMAVNTYIGSCYVNGSGAWIK